MLPLGVVIPTKNSLPYLPRHVEGLSPWLDLASEVVVVDSFSTDGTVDFLRKNLHHPGLRFTSHPPGLYASWNHGISQINAKYVFIATTGDTITRAGITKLVETADSLNCDVVISKPNFCDINGRALPDVFWPIDDIIATLGIKQPRKLHPMEAAIFAATNTGAAMMGSCASCVFRTETLKKFPFATDLGTVADGAWGRLHAAQVSWGVVADRFSNFLVHSPSSTTKEIKFKVPNKQIAGMLRDGVESWRVSCGISQEMLNSTGWNELISTLSSYLDAKMAFDQNRRSTIPWILNPNAWLNRFQRKISSKHLQKQMNMMLARLNKPCSRSNAL